MTCELYYIDDKYDPQLHHRILCALQDLLSTLDYSHPLQLATFMPLINITLMMMPGNTFEQGGLCLRQISHCCRIMGVLDDNFYESALFHQSRVTLIEIGRELGFFETTITRWSNYAQGKSSIY